MGSISHSELSVYRKCPQAHAYQYYDLLRRGHETPAVQLDLGTWWHAIRAADSINRSTRKEPLIYCPEIVSGPDDISISTNDISVDDVFEAIEQWWNRKDDDYREAFLAKYSIDILDHLEHMYYTWMNYARDSYKDTITLAVEMPFSISLPGTESDLIGVIDEIYLDHKRRLVVIRDIKTNYTIPEDNLNDIVDSQLHLYAYYVASHPDFKSYGYSYAVEYDRVRTKPPSTPALTAAGSLSKATTDYDLATYRAWCRDGILWGTEGEYYKSGRNKGKPKFGTYTAEQDVIDRLSTPAEQGKWFSTSTKPLNKYTIFAHLQAAVDTKMSITNSRDVWENTGVLPRNFSRYNCGYCDFFRVCEAELIGGYGNYDLDTLGLIKKEKRR